MPDFFDVHDRFLRTDGVGAWPDRLNARHAAIVDRNRHLFERARVLDLASHDGRWSFAALKAGACHVTGIEARGQLVGRANALMQSYCVAGDRFAFVEVDILKARHLHEQRFELVMCLGYFYHTMHHVAVLELIHATGAPALIIDTMVAPGDDVSIRIARERVDHIGAGYSDSGLALGRLLIGRPTVPALNFMLAHYGFSAEYFDWPALISARRIPVDASAKRSNRNPVVDYALGERITALAIREPDQAGRLG